MHIQQCIERKKRMLREIIFLNGIYDLACAAVHLRGGGRNFLSRLHADMFPDPLPAEVQQRMLAYWILTYGIVRAASLFGACEIWRLVVASNYFVEAMAYSLEGFWFGTADKRKAAWVAATSLLLGGAAALAV